MKIIIVIPTFNEPNILEVLNSLDSCEYSKKSEIEIIVAINQTLDSDEKIIHQNLQTYNDCLSFYFDKIKIITKIYTLEKQSVGLARKLGMDEAYQILLKSNKLKNGIIVNLDADCKVEKNYLIAIENHFIKYPKTPAASIYFEHQIIDNQYITDYELHLRYVVNALRWTGHPYAYQTVGSCMAVRAEAYKKQGGMNSKLAGEDFYFLQKMMDLGNFSDILDTTVIPSSRISDRVPFGTGRAMADMIKTEKWNSYHFNSYLDIKSFITQTENIYNKNFKYDTISIAMKNYLNDIDFENKITEIRMNTANYLAFKKRFFNWFNGFMVMKYLNFTRENYYSKQSIKDAIQPLLNELIPEKKILNTQEILNFMRSFDKNRGQYVSL